MAVTQPPASCTVAGPVTRNSISAMELPTDLRGADLSHRDLRGADLTDANLTGADLTDANLTGAKLTGADLTDVIGYKQ